MGNFWCKQKYGYVVELQWVSNYNYKIPKIEHIKKLKSNIHINYIKYLAKIIKIK